MPEIPKPNILIGVLRERYAMWAFVDCLAHMTQFLDRKKIDWAIMGLRATNIYKGREKIANILFKDGGERHTHLLFIDSDQTFVPATAHYLAQLDLPIVSGLVFQRIPPHLPTIYKRAENDEEKSWPLAIELKEWFDKHNVPILGAPHIFNEPSDEEAIWEVDECGTGCIMIKREVFETIPKPWFQGCGPIGTDLMFCRRARAHGFPIYADLRVQLGHVANYQVTQADFRGVDRWQLVDPTVMKDE